MKRIPLTQSRYTLVDDSDFIYLNKFKWHFDGRYATRVTQKNYKKTKIYMHQLINQTPQDFDTDHIDRNPLNNQRSNLRTVTHWQNGHNVAIRETNTSGVKGVSFHKQTQKWHARIEVNKKRVNLGLYSTLQGAFLARRWGERLYLGRG